MASQTHIEFSGTHNMFSDELEILKKLSSRFMDSITRMSDYNRLRISIKPQGNILNTTQRSFKLNLLLSRGNRVVQVSKEISRGTADELHNDRVNTAHWDLSKTLKSAFTALERRIKVS